MRELVSIGLCLGVVTGAGCVHGKVAPTPVAAAAAPAPPAAPASLSLVVHDPTDLTGRLASSLAASLAAVGVTAHVVKERSAAVDPLIVEVEVLNRQRSVDDPKTKRQGLPTAPGFGVIAGAKASVDKPEATTGPREQFNSGKVASESDLRLITTAVLTRRGDSEPLGRWDDTEGTLIPRAGDGTQPVLHPWHALYGALADHLATQIRAAIPK